jgi:hypothetical protein
MKQYVTLAALLLYMRVYAQVDSIPFNDFHRITIENYFTDPLSTEKKNPILLIVSSGYYVLPGKVDGRVVRYFKTRDEAIRYMRKPFIKNRQTVYHIYDSIISPDTIDVLISQLIIATSFRKTMIGVSCGGDLGYIPEARFVRQGEWLFISGTELTKNERGKLTKDGAYQYMKSTRVTCAYRLSSR